MIYIFLHISNHVLYDRDLLERVLMLPEKLGMVFHNITTVDLAKDFTKINPVTIIRKMYKDKDITTIINGKALRDRKQTIIGFSQTYSISLDRLKNPTISVKQAKAVLVEALKDKMRNGIAHFVFQKKDGSLREAWGTTNRSLAEKYINGNGVTREAYATTAYFDVEAGGWRSFRWENLVMVY